MKKTLPLLLLCSFFLTAAYSQKEKDFVNPHPDALPGHSYGFEWPTPPPLPPDPTGNPPEVWSNDLSVSIHPIGMITQERGRPYFTLRYQVQVSNRSRGGPLAFNLQVKHTFDPPAFTLLDPSVVKVPNKYYRIELESNGSQTFEDTLHIFYPFTIKSRGAKKTFLKIPVEVTAELPSYGYRHQDQGIILQDPNKENNSDQFTLTTPVPMPYLPPNTN